jgi:putative transposase
MQTKYERLTDAQWEYVKDKLGANRPTKVCLRLALDAILFVARTGLQWRNLPPAFGNHNSVYYYFAKWAKNGTITLIMNDLTAFARQRRDRAASPSLLIVDSQSTKCAPFTDRDKGVDGHKKVNDRKRHIIVDSNGLPVAVRVTAANAADGEAALEMLPMLGALKLDRLRVVRADGAYKGAFTAAAAFYDWRVDTTQAPPPKDCPKVFLPQKNRWQVECSFGWLNFYRRLSKDYEKTAAAAAAFISLAFCAMMLAKIT